MTDSIERTKVLITVITYPLPSRGYQELVCTAGVTESGDWVRLYPVDYRYRPTHQQFRKYQWIEVDLSPHGAGNDQRKESRRPSLDSIRMIGEPLSTQDGWRERRAVIDRLPVHTVNELQVLYDSGRTSLGIVRPSKVLDLTIEDADSEWKPEWQILFDQLKLFGTPQKPLRKIPFKFSYVFECQDSVQPHQAMVEDWERGRCGSMKLRVLAKSGQQLTVFAQSFSMKCAALIRTLISSWEPPFPITHGWSSVSSGHQSGCRNRCSR